jgi:hypothetical protein
LSEAIRKLDLTSRVSLQLVYLLLAERGIAGGGRQGSFGKRDRDFEFVVIVIGAEFCWIERQNLLL